MLLTVLFLSKAFATEDKQEESRDEVSAEVNSPFSRKIAPLFLNNFSSLLQFLTDMARQIHTVTNTYEKLLLHCAILQFAYVPDPWTWSARVGDGHMWQKRGQLFDQITSNVVQCTLIFTLSLNTFGSKCILQIMMDLATALSNVIQQQVGLQSRKMNDSFQATVG